MPATVYNIVNTLCCELLSFNRRRCSNNVDWLCVLEGRGCQRSRARATPLLYCDALSRAAMPITPRMTPVERSVARDMHSRGLTPAHIAKELGRGSSSITRLSRWMAKILAADVLQQCREETPPGLRASMHVAAFCAVFA